MTEQPKILNRPVVNTAPAFAYACGHPYPGTLNLSAIKCPACREKERT